MLHMKPLLNVAKEEYNYYDTGVGSMTTDDRSATNDRPQGSFTHFVLFQIYL